jgi:disulfide bond formation protein DsbB
VSGGGVLRLSPRTRLVGLALGCVAAVGTALVSQHAFGMEPCPWCVLQRVIFLAIALVCLLAAAVPARLAVFTAALLSIALALGGVAAALYQHFVAAKSQSCNLTLADKIVGALRLEPLAPDVFQVRANCADAAVNLLGVPYEFWSLVLFVLVMVVAITLMRAPTRRVS